MSAASFSLYLTSYVTHACYCARKGEGMECYGEHLLHVRVLIHKRVQHADEVGEAFCHDGGNPFVDACGKVRVALLHFGKGGGGKAIGEGGFEGGDPRGAHAAEIYGDFADSACLNGADTDAASIAELDFDADTAALDKVEGVCLFTLAY